MKIIERNGETILVTGDNEDEDDWLKRVDGGRHQKLEFEIYEKLKKIHQERMKNRQKK